MSNKIKIRIFWYYEKETGEYFTELDKEEAIYYMWGNGNYSCDCNRSMFFGLAEKYPKRCEDIELLSFPCGETIKIKIFDEHGYCYLDEFQGRCL